MSVAPKIRSCLACTRVSESRNLRVPQCAMWDFNKHRSNTVRSLNFFDIECEFLRRREEIERVGWLVLDFGPRRSAILRWISPSPGSNRLYQFQEIVKFKFIVGLKSLKSRTGFYHIDPIGISCIFTSSQRTGVRDVASASFLSRFAEFLPHFPHISALRTVLFRFSDYFNFHPHIGSLE